MSISAALVGGFVGTIVLTTALRMASDRGWTRMDLPLLLGTMMTTDRPRAKAAGFAMHFGFGLLFSIAYWVVFSVTDMAGLAFGLVLGLVHALFAGTTLVAYALPAVHPHMGSAMSAADSTPLLEAPGFMMLNYGRSTPVVMVIGHLAYGAIIGWMVARAA